MTRTLTEAEGRVIAVLLGGAGTTERDRLHRIQVPRSTYHAARKRAYDEGWLADRYVPDPSRFGRPIATFVVVRPYVDRAAELLDTWSQHPSNVMTWTSAQFALGVFFETTTEGRDGRGASKLAPSSARWQFVVHADVRTPSVPVYFDYEGIWSHLARFPGTATYPNGLGGSLGPDHADAPEPTRHQRWAAGELVHRPFVAAPIGRAGHLVGPLGLPFSQQRMLRQGWVVHRVLLDASKIPPYHGRAAEQMSLVMGELRPGARPEALFATLTRECRVFPFLYVTDGTRVLLGALGRNPTSPTAPEESDGARRPVLPVIQAALQGIEVLSDSVESIRTVVDHRYDRLFPKDAPTGPSTGRP